MLARYSAGSTLLGCEIGREENLVARIVVGKVFLARPLQPYEQRGHGSAKME